MASHRPDATLPTLRALFATGTTAGLTDADLLDRFAVGDRHAAEPAFAALVERHGPRVLRVCRQVLGNSGDADDAFQATFLILARKAGSIRQRGSLAAWLHGVAAHVAASARSAAKRRRRHEIEASAHRPRTAPEFPPAADLEAVILDELRQLPERYRTAVVLCCLQGLTQQEAAHEAGWPLGTLQSRLARGRDRLRDRLTRRGYAPSVAFVALDPALQIPWSSLSIPLVQTTTRVALAGAAGGSLATGAVPVAVQALAQGALRTMFLLRLKILGLAGGLLATGAVGWTFQTGPVVPTTPPPGASPAPVVKESDPTADGLTIRGMVVVPPGVRFADVEITSVLSEDYGLPPTTRPDDAGRFALRTRLFGWARLHAQTGDGRLQALLTIAQDSARTTLSQPVKLRLIPAIPHPVLVRAEGQPVAGATIIGQGPTSRVTETTGSDGLAQLYWPDGEKLDRVTAWHPVRGGNGSRVAAPLGQTTMMQIDLLPPQPQTVRAVDQAGQEVAGLELAFNFLAEGKDDDHWIMTDDLPAAHLRTDATGTAIVPWAPRPPLRSIEVNLASAGWKIDQTDRDRLTEGITTIHVRREHAVEGRLVMPEGASAAGILVTGFGFGPQNNGDVPVARARADGRFTLNVPSSHGYALGVVDSAWASDIWTGQILATDDAPPAEITIPVYPATPLTIRVTRGPDHKPVAEAFVQVGTKTDFTWTDPTGERRNGTSGPGFWTRTDATGVAHAGVGRGKHTVRLSLDSWEEERTVEVTAAEPRSVEFYRPWVGQRRVDGHLTDGGAPSLPTLSLTLRAWTTQGHQPPERIDLPVGPDGSFTIERDAASFQILAFDPARQRAGFAQVGPETSTVDLALWPTATYGGTLVDEDQKPLPDRTIEVRIKDLHSDPITTTRTDAQGHFQFLAVPARTALGLHLRDDKTPAEGWSLFLFDRDRMFDPGETRLDQTLQAQWGYGGPLSTPPPRPTATTDKLPPLTASIDLIGGNAQVSGMRALAVISGDDSPPVAALIGKLLDDEGNPAILSYLPTRLNAARVVDEAATLDRLGWTRPGAGAVALIVLDPTGKPLASVRLATADQPVAIEKGQRFLRDHRPPAHDARATVAEARAEAARSGRRVWLIIGGPRCGPCFRLARWVEAHRATLERDYVVVKIMEGLDDHAAEVKSNLPIQPGEGIPWHAITQPDGSILTTSVGPLGNIGLPNSVEGLRHYRAMLDATRQRLTPAEVDGLVDSLREVQ